MLPFNLAIVTRCHNSNALVFDPEIQESLREERFVCGLRYLKRVREFGAVVGLNPENRDRSMPNQLA